MPDIEAVKERLRGAWNGNRAPSTELARDSLEAIEALEAQATYFYLADGTTITLPPDEVKRRRIEAAKALARSESARERLREALTDVKRELLMPISLWAEADRRMLPRPHLMSPNILIELADRIRGALADTATQEETP